MADFGIDLRDSVAEVCRTNADEIGAVLSRALDQSFSIVVGEPRNMPFGDWPETWKDAGLALTLDIEGQFAVLIMPHGDGLIPAWCQAPDATGKSKLETLALELGMNILPDEFMPGDSRAAYSPDLAAALSLATGTELAFVPWIVSAGSVSGEAALLLPLQSATAMFDLEIPAADSTTTETQPSTTAADSVADADSKTPAATPAPKPTPATSPTPAAASAATQSDREDEIDERVYDNPHERLEHELHLLPPYVRSLLRVKVTVSVCLASTKTKVSRIVDMGPGAIIQFDKNCESPLTVEVAGIEVAEGEAVKIGDKFGLRVQAIVLPPERFISLPKRRSA